MTILLIISFVFACMFIAFCALPVRLFWDRKKDESSRWGVFLGIMSITSDGVTILGIRGKTKKERKDVKPQELEKEKAKARKKERKRGKKKNFQKILTNKGHRQTIKRIVISFAKTLVKVAKGFRTRKAEICIYASSEDPFVLGYACAVFYIIEPFLLQLMDIRFFHDFSIHEDNIEILGEFSIQTRVYKILFAILHLFWIVPKWKTIKLIRVMRN